MNNLRLQASACWRPRPCAVTSASPAALALSKQGGASGDEEMSPPAAPKRQASIGQCQSSMGVDVQGGIADGGTGPPATPARKFETPTNAAEGEPSEAGAMAAHPSNGTSWRALSPDLPGHRSGAPASVAAPMGAPAASPKSASARYNGKNSGDRTVEASLPHSAWTGAATKGDPQPATAPKRPRSVGQRQSSMGVSAHNSASSIDAVKPLQALPIAATCSNSADGDLSDLGGCTKQMSLEPAENAPRLKLLGCRDGERAAS
mmetsp:Transcript_42057/g.122001  ORF Transcript_42057/g.122001 Transcript_42057/m.122001 type:complete len:262 (-) Transcript_42057:464-1249(-)